MTMAEESHFPLMIEFSGGLEMLFGNKRTLLLQVPALDAQGVAITAGWLVKYLCEEIMIDARKDMLVLDGHVRPGVLVLINDMDWELEGDAAYVLQPNDNILFISTLHGG